MTKFCAAAKPNGTSSKEKMSYTDETVHSEIAGNCVSIVLEWNGESFCSAD